MKIKNWTRAAALLAVFAILVLSAAAATLGEMYENGVVSDGNVRFGDARDGVVSDVSEPMAGEAHRIRNGYDTPLTDGGNDHATGSVTGDDFGLNDGIGMNDDNILMGRSGTADSSAASGSTAAGTANAGGGNAGMVWGIIIAILVIIAVVVLVMLFMPKKRG